MKTWFTSLPDSVRAGINTAWQSALGSFVLMILGWLDDVKEYVDTDAGEFPSVTPLGKGGASIVLGLVTGVLVTIFRHFKPGPSYSNTPAGEPNHADRGQATSGLIWTVVGVLAVIALVIWIFGGR